MTWCKRTRTSLLFSLGALALALWNTAQLVISRTGRTNDYTDFGLGIVFGVGVGLMLLVAYRSGRKRRGNPLT